MMALATLGDLLAFITMTGNIISFMEVGHYRTDCLLDCHAGP